MRGREGLKCALVIFDMYTRLFETINKGTYARTKRRAKERCVQHCRLKAHMGIFWVRKPGLRCTVHGAPHPWPSNSSEPLSPPGWARTASAHDQCSGASLGKGGASRELTMLLKVIHLGDTLTKRNPAHSRRWSSVLGDRELERNTVFVTLMCPGLALLFSTYTGQVLSPVGD